MQEDVFFYWFGYSLTRQQCFESWKCKFFKMGSKVKSFEYTTRCELAIPVDVETATSRLLAHARYICGSIAVQWQEDNATQNMKMTAIMAIFSTIPVIMHKVFLQFTTCTSRATYYIVSLPTTSLTCVHQHGPYWQTNVHADCISNDVTWACFLKKNKSTAPEEVHLAKGPKREATSLLFNDMNLQLCKHAWEFIWWFSRQFSEMNIFILYWCCRKTPRNTEIWG